MKQILLFLIVLFNTASISAQIYQDKKLEIDSTIESGDNSPMITSNVKSKALDYDSIWCFHPFSVKISPGIWIPIGTSSDYFAPSFQLGFSMDLMISHKMRVEVGLYPRFMRNSKQILVVHNDSIVQAETHMAGSIGGWLSHELYKDKLIFTELIAGFSWEPLDAKLDYSNSNGENDSLSFSTWGFSIGLNTWINTFGRQNIGLKVMYQFAGYDRLETISSKLGGHSYAISLVYRFPKRKDIFRKYY